MWLLVSEWLQSIPQIAVCRHTLYWAMPPLLLCDKQRELSWDAADGGRASTGETRGCARLLHSSGRSPEPKTHSLYTSAPLLFQRHHNPFWQLPSLWIDMAPILRFQQSPVKGCSSFLLSVPRPPPSGAVVEISSFESSSAFPFSKCVSLVSLCSSCASTSSAATLRLIFRALHPPWRASLQSPSRLTTGVEKRKAS